ncbi:MAG: hypothetical protein V5A64_02725 [Candidatus Thermoplasmatota archaeon]
MWILLLLVVIICVLIALFFITVKRYKNKIETLQKKGLNKTQKMKQLRTKKDQHDEVMNKLKNKNKKLKTTTNNNEKLVKINQQFRNQLSELEEKNELLQENKRKLQEDREKLKQKLEKIKENYSHLNKENKELKNSFINNEKIKSYKTIIKEALILQTFLNNDTQHHIQILHDFSELSEETIKEYLAHLCNLNLLKQVEDDTYQRNFSIKTDEEVFHRLICKIFDCDLQKLRQYLK